jgi:hypothetical protein
MALRVAGYRWKQLEPLLAEFRIVSNDTLAFLRGLGPGDWIRRGRHPTLGRISLGDLARIEMEHERDHARQLGEAASRRRHRQSVTSALIQLACASPRGVGYSRYQSTSVKVSHGIHEIDGV